MAATISPELIRSLSNGTDIDSADMLLIGRRFQSELRSQCAIFEVPNDVNARELKESRESQMTCRRYDT